MQSSRSLVWLCRHPIPAVQPGKIQSRPASLTSAINRGIRRGNRGIAIAERRGGRQTFSEEDSARKSTSQSEGGSSRTGKGFFERRPKPFTGSRNEDDNSGLERESFQSRRAKNNKSEEDDDDDEVDRHKPFGLLNPVKKDSIRASKQASLLSTSRRSSTSSDASRERRPYGRDASGKWPYRKSSDIARGASTGHVWPRRSADNFSHERPVKGDSLSREGLNPQDRSSRFAGSERSKGYTNGKTGQWETDQEVKPRSRRPNQLPKARDGDGEDVVQSHSKLSALRNRPHVPSSIPYTTAGSEFIYGTFAVQAALKAGRRRLHVLYIYKSEETPEGARRHDSMRKLALAAGVKVQLVGTEWNRLLMQMSSSRPHNGFVLEASPIPKLPVTALQPVAFASKTFDVSVAYQSAEEHEVNAPFDIIANTSSLSCTSPSERFPLVLLVDRILDPGNLGAIIRSAHFLGVEALAVIDYGSSPFSPVTVKASAGAAEYFPITIVKKEHQFIKDSQQNGWKFFAAMAPGGESASKYNAKRTPSMEVQSALQHAPCVLMLGNEGEGLRPQLARLADGVAGIERVGPSDQGVDSLNVSVAAALLVQEFLKPSAAHGGARRRKIPKIQKRQTKS